MENIKGWRVTIANGQDSVVKTALYTKGECGLDALPDAIYSASCSFVANKFLTLEVMANAVANFQDDIFDGDLADECGRFVVAAVELTDAIDKWRGRVK